MLRHHDVCVGRKQVSRGSSGEDPLAYSSFRNSSFPIPDWRIIEANVPKGTSLKFGTMTIQVLSPAVRLSLMWLPLCEARTNPAPVRILIILRADNTGSFAIVNLERRDYRVRFRKCNIFIVQIELDSFP